MHDGGGRQSAPATAAAAAAAAAAALTREFTGGGTARWDRDPVRDTMAFATSKYPPGTLPPGGVYGEGAIFEQVRFDLGGCCGVFFGRREGLSNFFFVLLFPCSIFVPGDVDRTFVHFHEIRRSFARLGGVGDLFAPPRFVRLLPTSIFFLFFFHLHRASKLPYLSVPPSPCTIRKRRPIKMHCFTPPPPSAPAPPPPPPPRALRCSREKFGTIAA